MPKNLVQFQKGLSLGDFFEQYGSEDKCHTALFQLHWPQGYECPKCGNVSYCELKGRKLYQCNRCHYQTSVTAGTIFHGTHVPLKKWFLAIYLVTQRKNGISALQLSREIGVSANTGWMIKHKLMQVMLNRERGKKLCGRIEIDDAYLGGELSGKRGRGSKNKIPFIAAVETVDGKPLRIQLRCVKGFCKTEIARYAKCSLEAESHVVSDGLRCFVGVGEAHCQHTAIVTGGGRKSVKLTTFKWVNTILGNVKNSLRGTFHAFREKHASRYLAEFEYRFNRRFHLNTMIERLTYVSLRTPPLPYRLLILAEPIG